MIKKFTVFLCFLFLLAFSVQGEVIYFKGGSQIIGKNLDIYEDKDSKLDFKTILNVKDFKASEVDVPNEGLSNSSYWLKFSIHNTTRKPNLYLELAYPLIHACELYTSKDGKTSLRVYTENDDFETRDIAHQNLVFPVTIKQGTTASFYLKISGFNQVVLPLMIRDEPNFFQSSLVGETINGIFSGIIIVMILYNLFIFFSTKDRSYLFYVLYILCIGLAQTTLTGYAYKYLWPGAPHFNSQAAILFSALSGIFAVFFIKHFLSIREKWPKGELLLNIIIVLYTIGALLNLLGFESLSYRAMDISGAYGTIATILVAVRLSRANYRPAKFFLIAWSMFLIGLILFVLRNINILPYNLLTSYTMQTGSILEVILLSFALADKINILKKEREASQEEALRVSKENEKIIREQNVSLENKVNERTVELSNKNEKLNEALTQLKDAQTQLIESEKMVSLGQLTAGIAHEINNPINFVSSNVRPLRRDIEDVMAVLTAYESVAEETSIESIGRGFEEVNRLKEELDINYIKDELDTLLNGMEDGAKRTVEIVKGLKIFSRIDEADLNLVNINEGMDSTLVILNYQLGSEIRLVKNLGSLPSVECYPGKINQVFMNILTNAIYALKQHPKENWTPTIWVTTKLKDDKNVSISIKDNGIGIPTELKTKIFDPFFTTKQVGEGTGLGLSIVFKIIEVHDGTIDVISEEGEGTEFIITLPIIKKKRPIPELNE